MSENLKLKRNGLKNLHNYFKFWKIYTRILKLHIESHSNSNHLSNVELNDYNEATSTQAVFQMRTVDLENISNQNSINNDSANENNGNLQ